MAEMYEIAASADDGQFHRSTIGVWTIRDNYAGFSFGRNSALYRSFMRFALNIPAGASIVSAYIDFTAGTSQGAFTTAIRLIDADDCGNINSFSADQSDMALTGDTVSWTPAAWVLHGAYSSPDIASLVQAYIDRGGYDTGQYIGLFINEGDAAANELRSIFSFDQATYAIPTLRVIYVAEVSIIATLKGAATARYPEIAFSPTPDDAALASPQQADTILNYAQDSDITLTVPTADPPGFRWWGWWISKTRQTWGKTYAYTVPGTVTIEARYRHNAGRQARRWKF